MTGDPVARVADLAEQRNFATGPLFGSSVGTAASKA